MQCEVTDHGAVPQDIGETAFAGVRKQARDAYRRFQQDPTHRSLGFKQVHTTLPIYAVRVGKGYRAVGQRIGNDIVWFWIGSHAEYDKLLSQL